MLKLVPIGLLLLVAAAATAAEEDFDYTCFAGIYPSAGVTIPRGDISVEVGSDPFDIFCRMNPDHKYFQRGYNASHLFFTKEDGDKMETRIVNETTIVHTYDPTESRRDQISCKIDLEEGEKKEYRGICHQYVFAGRKSLPPQDFKCISENWQNLNCTWTEPENPVKTTYSLSYIEPGRFGHQKHCPEMLPKGNKPMPRQTCYMSLRTTPPFRQPLEIYQFLMFAENALDRADGGQYNKFPLNSFAVVRPGRPTDLLLLSPSPNSIMIKYSIPVELVEFPPGLVSAIRYRSQFDGITDWTQVDTSEFNQHDESFNVTLTGLIPHAEYTVEVRLRSSTANVTASNRLWSRVGRAKVVTQQTLPAAAPMMTPGSFEIVGGLSTRTVYVYWQRIDPTMQNGKDFKYSVSQVIEAGNVKPVNPVRLTSAFAEFPQLSLRNHTFYVASQNEIGDSVDTSSVFVDHTDRLRGLQPQSFTKIAYNDQQFEVSWNPPKEQHMVENYTVFWCRSENNRDRPYQCEGFLDWKIVPSDQRIVNVTLPTADIYQFAVSANAKDRSSGMTWATCTILHNRVVGKLKTVSVDRVNKDSMKLRWRLDCSDRVGIVTGYKISYCPIESEEDTADCMGGEEFSVTTPADKTSIELNDLKPWTVYKMGVSVLTRAGESELSDYKVNRTRRDRPGSPPTNLRVELLTRNKLQAIWQAPDLPNGPIESYEIRANYTDFKGEIVGNKWIKDVTDVSFTIIEDPLDGVMFAYDIPDLAFNAGYEIAVRACTKLPQIENSRVCGEDWASMIVTTGIGKSGQMPEPLVTFKNSTMAKVEWGHSGYHMGGPVKQFELKITHVNLDLSKIIVVDGGNSDVIVDLHKLGRDEDWVPDCANNSITNMYNFTIRDVTHDLEVLYHGDWSPVEVTPAYCQADTPWLTIMLVAGSVALIVVIGVIYCCVFYSSTSSTLHLLGQVNEKVKEAPLSGTITSGDGGHIEQGNHIWDEHHLKKMKYQYQRNTSMDAKTTLLPDPKRNISGSSDTTSGCESSRSSETDEEEEIEMEQEKSFSSAGSSLSSGSTERRMRRRNDTEVSELAPSSPASAGIHPYVQCTAKPKVFNGQIPFADPKGTNVVSPTDNPQGYSRFQASDIGAWPIAQSPTSPTAGFLPPGYSKVGMVADPRMGHPQNPPPCNSSYVAFEQAPNPNPPAGGGYVTVAQAQGAVRPAETTLPPRGYSKVALKSPVAVALKSPVAQAPPPASSGYVLQAAAMLPPASPNTGDYVQQQLMEDRLSNPALLSQMSEPLRQSPHHLASLPQSPSAKAALSPIALSPSHHMEVDGPPSVGYVQAHNLSSPKHLSEAVEGEDEEAKSLVMSPKSLTVESKSPYSKVFTTVQNSKSSMV